MTVEVVSMPDITKKTAISAVFELFPLCRQIFFSALYENENEINRSFTKTQFLVLMTLFTHKCLTMSQTAICVSSSKEQATRVVAPLVETGLLERFYDEANRRVVYIRLSEYGRSYMNSLQEAMINSVAEKLETLCEEDVNTLNESLLKVLEILKKLENS